MTRPNYDETEEMKMIDPTELFQRQWEDQDPLVAEINRLRDENRELRSVASDLISVARRDISILSRKKGPLHMIETTVTKGQVMRAINLLSHPTHRNSDRGETE